MTDGQRRRSFKDVVIEYSEQENSATKCTGNPKDCILCDMIRNIFEAFPTELNPGCETGGEQVP